ncbi:putative membrane protein [Mesorhizobium sp. J18]|uniref:TPM domain-containing protein n=1 Tax=Mesorhizobium sp. J18 TaxID=935263 RepID=UPI0011997363|nr:TPM domain-containing protein [Mesorhizobium sp. J18]TWG89030.1 putative membrane protein [Mesorhizobium sp. J18]
MGEISENILSPDEHARITAAIRDAESRTSGEIFCALAGTSDSYFFPAAFIATSAILLLSAIVAAVFHYWWIDIRPIVFVAAQLAALATAVLVIATFPRLRVRLVPRRIRYRRAHGNALRQFLAHNIHVTESRTGVLIFVSLAERYAEVVADAGINSLVDQSTWNDTVAALIRHAAAARLADGFVEAIGRVGTVLAEHFPPGAENPNELDDHLAEI